MQASTMRRTELAALSTTTALALACAAAVAAPRDPACVDGAQVRDPAAVFATPARAPQRPASRGAGLRDWPGRTHASFEPGRRPGWLDGLLSSGNAPAGQDPRLQQGVRAARDAMDEMGRQLKPALEDLQRGFDEGLERAQP